MAKKFIDKADISDVMIERPISFSIGRKRFAILPQTLGKAQLVARLVESMGVAEALAANRIDSNILKVADTHRKECLRLIAYSTLAGADCLDETKVLRRIKDLRRCDVMDIATLLLIILTQDKTELIEKEFMMDKEAKRLKEVMKVKEEDKNSMSFGGKSLWGTLIDAACERYGWSYQYVLWGVSYANLQLLLADQIRSVYLSDDEKKKLRIPTDGIVVKADNPTALKEFIKTQSWR